MTDEQLNGTGGGDAEDRGLESPAEQSPLDASGTGMPVTDAAADPSAAEVAASMQAGQGAQTGLELAPQYGVGPFSIREVALAGVWLVAFVVSFFSLSSFGFASVWTSGVEWILAIGVPTVAVFLLILRRLSPSGIRRVGSLGVDQFASVAFSVAAVVWLGQVWLQVSSAAAGEA